MSKDTNNNTTAFAKGVLLTLFVGLTGFNLVVGSFNIGVLKDRSRVAFVRTSEDCTVAIDVRDTLGESLELSSRANRR